MLRVIGVPASSTSGAAPDDAPTSGSERAPQALRDAGLIQALDAVDGGDLDVRIRNQERDAATGIRGWGEVSRLNDVVRAAVIETLHAGDLPIVIGGCCAALPGALAGARDALGVVALVYVDGHLDLYDGVTSRTGESADMALAIALGHGPDPWVDQVAGPLVPADGVAILGARDRVTARQDGGIMPEDLGYSSELDPETLHDLGWERAGRDTERALTTVAEGFWLHIDVDVLSSVDMPATDYVQEGGLGIAELAELLAPLGRSEGLIGVSVACFNPDKDSTDFVATHRLVSLITGLLRE